MSVSLVPECHPTHPVYHHEIVAPDVVRTYKEESFLIVARFSDGSRILRGRELFVQGILCGPAGQLLRFPLEDNGRGPDTQPEDGWYSGQIHFGPRHRGLWTCFVVAQDPLYASGTLSPAEAARIVVGRVKTRRLTTSFEGGTWALVPDGHVNVI